MQLFVLLPVLLLTVVAAVSEPSEDLSEADVQAIQKIESSPVLPYNVRQSLKELFGDKVSEKELDAMVQQVKDFDREPIFSNQTDEFTIMSFNTWMGGSVVRDGVQKIVKHIKAVNADVVAIQEGSMNRADLMKALGGSWKDVGAATQTFILTRHEILPNVTYNPRGTGTAATIKLPNGKLLNIWDVHFYYLPVGQHLAFENATLESIILGEERRMEDLKNVLENAVTKEWLKNDNVPTFIVGDHNTGSHLDWIEETKESHAGRVVEWPVTKKIMDAGFRDTWRVIYPNVTTHPGYTWSPVEKLWWGDRRKGPEPQDRVDFLFYKGTTITPIEMHTYVGNEVVKENIDNSGAYKYNDWPSDHTALVAKFAFK